MDWDKLRVFHAAAEAGSFTHAGEQLGLSQSAVSRQVSALEQELSVSLFHRHARGLILTEQGELLYRTAHEVFMKLEAARAKLTDSREKPHGELKVHDHARPRHALADAAARRVHRPLSRHPHHADHHRRGARPRHARGRRRDPAAPADPARPDPAQAVLGAFPRLRLARIPQARSARRARSRNSTTTASSCSAARRCRPTCRTATGCIEVGRDGKGPRTPHLTDQQHLGVLRACQRGLGIALLPDYLVEENGGLVQLFGEEDAPALDAYFVYPEELKSVARVQVFRDFLVATRSAGVSEFVPTFQTPRGAQSVITSLANGSDSQRVAYCDG